MAYSSSVAAALHRLSRKRDKLFHFNRKTHLKTLLK